MDKYGVRIAGDTYVSPAHWTQRGYLAIPYAEFRTARLRILGYPALRCASTGKYWTSTSEVEETAEGLLVRDWFAWINAIPEDYSLTDVASRLCEIGHRGIGQRTEEGYGRFTVCSARREVSRDGQWTIAERL